MSVTPHSVLFYGTPAIAEKALRLLLADPRYVIRAVVTQPDRPVGRKQILTPSSVKTLAESAHIPIFQPENIREDPGSFLRELKQLASIDIAVVVAFGQILPLEVLDFPRAGSLNLHASLLPRWRGAAPIQRAIMAGDAQTGICLMKMEAGLDTGAVYAREEIPIGSSDNAATIHDHLAQQGATLICENLSDIIYGTLKPIPQSHEGISYAKKITDKDCRIDWNLPAQTIANQIRGLSPVPGAFTVLDGKRLKIFCAEIRPVATSPSIPGQVTRTDSSLVIQTADQDLALLEVQFEGKKRASVLDFLRGNQVVSGAIFGGN